MSILAKRTYFGGPFTAYMDPSQIPPPWMSAPPTSPLQLGTDTAMRHWAVWACVSRIADTVSSMCCDAYTGDQGIAGEANEVDPKPSMLVRPSAYASWLQFVHQVMCSLLLQGNAYGLIASSDRYGYPTQIDLIAPDKVKVDRDERGMKRFRVGNRYMDETQIWHVPGPQLPGELAGMSPIQYAARLISLGIGAEQFGTDFFNNGVHPTAVATTDQPISPEQAQTIKERIKLAVRNRDVPVLGAGVKLSPWQVTPQDSQLLEVQRLNAVMVAQIFRVPPEMIGAATSGDSITYANREQRAQDFVNQAITPWLARLEDAISTWFPRTTWVRFDTDDLLRADILNRYKAYDLAISSGWLLKSEVRDEEDLPPVAGIDDEPTPPPLPPAPMANTPPANTPPANMPMESTPMASTNGSK